MGVKERLEEIAAAIARGASPKKFERELDRLLGTQMEERDEVAEMTWEESYRRGRTT